MDFLLADFCQRSFAPWPEASRRPGRPVPQGDVLEPRLPRLHPPADPLPPSRIGHRPICSARIRSAKRGSSACGGSADTELSRDCPALRECRCKQPAPPARLLMDSNQPELTVPPAGAAQTSSSAASPAPTSPPGQCKTCRRQVNIPTIPMYAPYTVHLEPGAVSDCLAALPG